MQKNKRILDEKLIKTIELTHSKSQSSFIRDTIIEEHIFTITPIKQNV